MRRAARVDANHGKIRDAFRRLGWRWEDTFCIGGGFPDGIASRNGATLLVEVKDGSRSPSKRKLREQQERFRLSWQGDYRIVESVDDVIAIDREFRGKDD